MPLPAARTSGPLPDRPGLPRQHLPLAHGRGRADERLAEAGLDDRVEVASCGTGDWHVGDPMDPRAAATLTARRLRREPAPRPAVRRDLARTTYDLRAGDGRGQPGATSAGGAERPGPACSATSIRSNPGATCRTRTTVGTTASRRCWRWSSARASCARRGARRAARATGAGAAVTRQPLVARRAEELLGTSVVATAPVAGGDIATATRLRLSDGTTALMKTLPHAPRGLLRARGRRAALARRGRGRRRRCPRCSAPTTSA